MTIAHLSGEDVRRFSELVQGYLAARGSVSASDQELEALGQLVGEYHAARVLEAIADAAALNPGRVTVDQLSAWLELHVPLLEQVMALYAQEIEPYQRITPKIRDQLIALVAEFPHLDWWQEAIDRAVSSNNRKLSTVHKILRDFQETGSWERPVPSRRPTDGTTRKPARRPASRETKYDEDELERIREAERNVVVKIPKDVF